MERLEIAKKIASAINGNVWSTKNASGDLDKVRVYDAKRGYADVVENGVNIDKCNRNAYDAVKAACAEIGVTTFRR